MEEAAQRMQLTTPQTCEEQIAQIRQQAEAAITSALDEGDAEVRARQAEVDEDALSPDLARPREQSRSSAPSSTGAQDGSAG
jgi:hypothetical protein